jgi:predicted dehydrogenase
MPWPWSVCAVDDDTIHLYTSDRDGQAELVREIEVPTNDTFVAELEHFLDCIERPEAEPITSGREARKPLAAVLAAYDSIRAGKRVDLAEIHGG